jgi:PhoPQ-activated pathogenicity-related protein
MPNVPTVKDFIIAGASKRGWTTWTTAGVDKRVRGFIPIVMPIGNMVETINEMYQVYGGWSFALQDYLDMHIMDDLNMPNFKKMADLIDPIVYNNLGRWANKPYYVIAAAGDEFFLPTSINHSWNQLNGNKYLRIVPDAEHSLVGQQLDVALSADSFINMVLNNEPVRTLQIVFKTRKQKGKKHPANGLIWVFIIYFVMF